MKKIVLVSFLMVTSGFSGNVNTGDKSPVQMGNTPTVNYNPTIYNINVRTPEEAVRLQQALTKTAKPTPTVPTKTVVPPNKAPAPIVTVAKPHYVAPPQPSNSVYVAPTGLKGFFGLSKGLQWQDNRDAKTVQRDWEGAKSYCTNLTLDGYSDWRLPSYPELLTIVDYTKYKPAIKTGFKNTATDDWYWSASPDVNRDSSAWVVDFDGGSTYYSTKARTDYVRCVRGRQ